MNAFLTLQSQCQTPNLYQERNRFRTAFQRQHLTKKTMHLLKSRQGESTRNCRGNIAATQPSRQLKFEGVAEEAGVTAK